MDFIKIFTVVPQGSLKKFRGLCKPQTINDLLDRLRMNYAFMIMPKTKPYIVINLNNLEAKTGNKIFNLIMQNAQLIKDKTGNYWFIHFFITSQQGYSFNDQRMFYYEENRDRMQVLLDIPPISSMSFSYLTCAAYYTQAADGQRYALFRAGQVIETPVMEIAPYKAIQPYLSNLIAEKFNNVDNTISIYQPNQSTNYKTSSTDWINFSRLGSAFFDTTLLNAISLFFITTPSGNIFSIGQSTQIQNLIFQYPDNDGFVTTLLYELGNPLLLTNLFSSSLGTLPVAKVPTLSSISVSRNDILSYLGVLAGLIELECPINFFPKMISIPICNTKDVTAELVITGFQNTMGYYYPIQYQTIDSRCGPQFVNSDDFLIDFPEANNFDEMNAIIRTGDFQICPYLDIEYIRDWVRVEVFEFDLTKYSPFVKLRFSSGGFSDIRYFLPKTKFVEYNPEPPATDIILGISSAFQQYSFDNGFRTGSYRTLYFDPNFEFGNFDSQVLPFRSFRLNNDTNNKSFGPVGFNLDFTGTTNAKPRYLSKFKLSDGQSNEVIAANTPADRLIWCENSDPTGVYFGCIVYCDASTYQGITCQYNELILDYLIITPDLIYYPNGPYFPTKISEVTDVINGVLITANGVANIPYPVINGVCTTFNDRANLIFGKSYLIYFKIDYSKFINEMPQMAVNFVKTIPNKFITAGRKTNQTIFTTDYVRGNGQEGSMNRFFYFKSVINQPFSFDVTLTGHFSPNFQFLTTPGVLTSYLWNFNEEYFQGVPLFNYNSTAGNISIVPDTDFEIKFTVTQLTPNTFGIGQFGSFRLQPIDQTIPDQVGWLQSFPIDVRITIRPTIISNQYFNADLTINAYQGPTPGTFGLYPAPLVGKRYIYNMIVESSEVLELGTDLKIEAIGSIRSTRIDAFGNSDEPSILGNGSFTQQVVSAGINPKYWFSSNPTLPSNYQIINIEATLPIIPGSAWSDFIITVTNKITNVVYFEQVQEVLDQISQPILQPASVPIWFTAVNYPTIDYISDLISVDNPQNLYIELNNLNYDLYVIKSTDGGPDGTMPVYMQLWCWNSVNYLGTRLHQEINLGNGSFTDPKAPGQLTWRIDNRYMLPTDCDSVFVRFIIKNCFQYPQILDKARVELNWEMRLWINVTGTFAKTRAGNVFLNIQPDPTAFYQTIQYSAVTDYNQSIILNTNNESALPAEINFALIDLDNSVVGADGLTYYQQMKSLVEIMYNSPQTFDFYINTWDPSYNWAILIQSELDVSQEQKTVYTGKNAVDPNTSIFDINATPYYVPTPLTPDNYQSYVNLWLNNYTTTAFWIEFDLNFFGSDRDFVLNQFNEITAIAKKENDLNGSSSMMVLTDTVELYGYGGNKYGLLYNSWDNEDRFFWQKLYKRPIGRFLISFCPVVLTSNTFVIDINLKRYLTLFFR